MKKQEIIAKIAETDGLIAELVELRSALKALLLVAKAKEGAKESEGEDE